MFHLLLTVFATSHVCFCGLICATWKQIARLCKIGTTKAGAESRIHASSDETTIESLPVDPLGLGRLNLSERSLVRTVSSIGEIPFIYGDVVAPRGLSLGLGGLGRQSKRTGSGCFQRSTSFFMCTDT
jgi:hypothetical protein